jgi:hypothetical protein
MQRTKETGISAGASANPGFVAAQGHSETAFVHLTETLRTWFGINRP